MPKIKRVKLSEFKNDPSSEVLVPKEYLAEVKVESEEDRILEFTISTNSVDRDGDTIKAAGWQLDNYRKNPVVLWGHDHSIPSIGKSLASWVEGDALKSRNQYPTRDEYEFGNLIYRLHAGSYLRAVSVGFIPKKYVINEERGSGGWGPPIDFLEQELLEHSSCNVPANAEALGAAAAKGLDMRPMLRWYEAALNRKDELIVDPRTYEDCWKILKGLCGQGAVIQLPLLVDTVGKIVGAALERGLPEVEDAPVVDKAASPKQRDVLVQRAVEQHAEDAKDKRVISYASAHADGTPKASRDDEWDGPGEVAAAEVDDLKVMCAWVDEENDENKGAYKIPHHKAGGQHAVVWRGITAAAARLPQTDIPAGDVSGIESHLGRHYVEFDEVAPWDREEDAWSVYVESCKELSAEEADVEFQKLFCERAEGDEPDPPAEPPADPEVTIDPETSAEPPEVPPSEQDTDPGIAVDPDPDVEAEFEAVTERLESLARQVSKAGRVLSGANENRLRRSRDLLDEVLSQLEDQDDDGKTLLTDDEGNVLLTLDEGQLSEITDAAKDIAATELRRASGALD